MGSSSFHMFIYARSEQCDSGPIYTTKDTQRIRIYPGKLKFILVKISPDPGRLHDKHAKENQTLFMFLTTENLSGLTTENLSGLTTENLSLKQMGSSSFHMFIYARSEQCDSGPIYTTKDTQRIRIYPGKLKFILVKISPDPPPVHTSANTERFQICPVRL